MGHNEVRVELAAEMQLMRQKEAAMQGELGQVKASNQELQSELGNVKASNEELKAEMERMKAEFKERENRLIQDAIKRELQSKKESLIRENKIRDEIVAMFLKNNRKAT